MNTKYILWIVQHIVRLKQTHFCSQVGKNMSKILTTTADPTTPITTTHMTRKKRGRDSEQKRLRRSLTCSTHWHIACREDGGKHYLYCHHTDQCKSNSQNLKTLS